MALSAGYTPRRRGQPPASGVFSYQVAAGETIWRGGMVAVNSAGNLVRIQTSGASAFVGNSPEELKHRQEMEAE